MHFPISGITVNPAYLAGIGFIVGILAGFFGVGGGFLTGPMLLIFGMPGHMVPGTDLAYMTGKSIVAARRHRALGHVDVKLGVIMVTGTVIGVELGAQLIEALKRVGGVEKTLGLAYIVTLLSVSGFVAWESFRAIRQMSRTEAIDVQDAIGFQAFTKRVQRIDIPPMISLPESGIESISFWAVFGVGIGTGFLAGFLGVGGGFIRMPALVYVLGAPTHIAVGTDLFEIVVSSGYGALTHGIKGNVDILVALVMHTGAAVGAQIGAVSTRYVGGPKIRLAFSVLPLIGAALIIVNLSR
ncbi:MAG: sulfite exporter TauE/SafE family protein [Anaerolineae bacterium]